MPWSAAGRATVDAAVAKASGTSVARELSADEQELIQKRRAEALAARAAKQRAGSRMD